MMSASSSVSSSLHLIWNLDGGYQSTTFWFRELAVIWQFKNIGRDSIKVFGSCTNWRMKRQMHQFCEVPILVKYRSRCSWTRVLISQSWFERLFAWCVGNCGMGHRMNLVCGMVLLSEVWWMSALVLILYFKWTFIKLKSGLGYLLRKSLFQQLVASFEQGMQGIMSHRMDLIW